MASAATDALDGTLQRTDNPGDRHQLVVHHDITPDGKLGPGLRRMVKDHHERHRSRGVKVVDPARC